MYVCNCTMPKMLCQDQKLEIPDKNIDFSLKVSILKSIKEQYRLGGCYDENQR